MLAVLCGVGILGAVRDGRLGGDIAWARSYTGAVQRAHQSGKPLLLTFHAPDCGWCEKLDAETFTDPKVVELSRRLVCVRAEQDVDTALIERYHVSAFPLTLLLSPEGKTLLRIPGYLPADRFVPLLRNALNGNSETAMPDPAIPLDIHP